jgi:hypothetical protein
VAGFRKDAGRDLVFIGRVLSQVFYYNVEWLLQNLEMVTFGFGASGAWWSPWMPQGGRLWWPSVAGSACAWRNGRTQMVLNQFGTIHGTILLPRGHPGHCLNSGFDFESCALDLDSTRALVEQALRIRRVHVYTRSLPTLRYAAGAAAAAVRREHPPRAGSATHQASERASEGYNTPIQSYSHTHTGFEAIL